MTHAHKWISRLRLTGGELTVFADRINYRHLFEWRALIRP